MRVVKSAQARPRAAVRSPSPVLPEVRATLKEVQGVPSQTAQIKPEESH